MSTRNRIGLFAAVLALTSFGVANAQATFTTPDWYINLTDYGYSDFLIYTAGAFPEGNLHEMLSGEWAAAIGYDGIGLPAPHLTMWLEPNFEYPYWTSNSTFTVVSPMTSLGDIDGDGLDEGEATISNGVVQVRMRIDLEDTITGTPIGTGSSAVLSNRYVMRTTYEIENVSGATLTGLRFYQFTHAHPANDETADIDARYDTSLYAGTLSSFRYDITQHSVNSGATDGGFTGCEFEDYVSHSSEVAPGDWGLGHFRGHIDRPATGLHVDVENDTLGNQTSFGPDETAGAHRWDLGSLAADATTQVEVLLAVRSADLSPQATSTACLEIAATGGDPEIWLTRGACSGGSSSPPMDVITGRLNSIIDGGTSILLGAVTCRADELTLDRLTLVDTLSTCGSDALFVLARRGAFAQFDWGASSAGVPRFALIGDCP